MAVKIRIDQVTRPPGVPGQAREDLVLGQIVTLTAIGGPFFSYLWSIIDKPIDISIPQRSAAVLATPTGQATTLSPIDKPNTYNVQLQVDAGHGLGARPEDVVQITFYAGPTLAADPADLPNRQPAFGERLQHNVPNAVDILGNTIGWAYDKLKQSAIIARMWATKSWACGRIRLPGGGPATITRSFRVASATRTGVGIVDIVFSSAMPDGSYSPSAAAITTDGFCSIGAGFGAAGFTVRRFNAAGVLTDADFTFDVKLGA